MGEARGRSHRKVTEDATKRSNCEPTKETA